MPPKKAVALLGFLAVSGSASPRPSQATETVTVSHTSTEVITIREEAEHKSADIGNYPVTYTSTLSPAQRSQVSAELYSYYMTNSKFVSLATKTASWNQDDEKIYSSLIVDDGLSVISKVINSMTTVLTALPRAQTLTMLMAIRNEALRTSANTGIDPATMTYIDPDLAEQIDGEIGEYYYTNPAVQSLLLKPTYNANDLKKLSSFTIDVPRSISSRVINSAEQAKTKSSNKHKRTAPAVLTPALTLTVPMTIRDEPLQTSAPDVIDPATVSNISPELYPDIENEFRQFFSTRPDLHEINSKLLVSSTTLNCAQSASLSSEHMSIISNVMNSATVTQESPSVATIEATAEVVAGAASGATPKAKHASKTKSSKKHKATTPTIAPRQDNEYVDKGKDGMVEGSVTTSVHSETLTYTLSVAAYPTAAVPWSAYPQIGSWTLGMRQKSEGADKDILSFAALVVCLGAVMIFL